MIFISGNFRGIPLADVSAVYYEGMITLWLNDTQLPLTCMCFYTNFIRTSVDEYNTVLTYTEDRKKYSRTLDYYSAKENDTLVLPKKEYAKLVISYVESIEILGSDLNDECQAQILAARNKEITYSDKGLTITGTYEFTSSLLFENGEKKIMREFRGVYELQKACPKMKYNLYKEIVYSMYENMEYDMSKVTVKLLTFTSDDEKVHSGPSTVPVDIMIFYTMLCIITFVLVFITMAELRLQRFIRNQVFVTFV